MERNWHRSKKFKDLSWLIDRDLEYFRGLNCNPDGYVRIIKDYPRTVLIEMEFIVGKFLNNVEPRKLRYLIPKASLVTGDFLLKLPETTEFIVGDLVSDIIYKEPFSIKTSTEYALLV